MKVGRACWQICYWDTHTTKSRIPSHWTSSPQQIHPVMSQSIPKARSFCLADVSIPHFLKNLSMLMLWPTLHLTVNAHSTTSFFNSHLPLKALCCHDAWINCQQLGYCCVVVRIHQADQDCLILFLHSPSVCIHLLWSQTVLMDCVLSGAITIFFLFSTCTKQHGVPFCSFH